jgi:cytochrome c peroxidase
MRYTMNTKVLLLLSSIFLTACGGDESSTTPLESVANTPSTPTVAEPTDLEIALEDLQDIMNATSPTGSYEGYILPESDDFLNIPQDPNNPITAEKVALGKLIYHETGITSDGLGKTDMDNTWSCASCHNGQNGFKSGIRQGIGEGGVGFNHRTFAEGMEELADIQPVTSPTVLNTAYQEVMLWNGQFGNVVGGIVNVGIDPERHFTEGTPKGENLRGFAGLETQALAGLVVHRMNAAEPDSILSTNEKYQMMFEAAYGTSQPNDMLEAAALAIAAYERTILANQAPFQKMLRGDANALSLEEVEGAKVFFGKGGCAGCHNGPALSSPVGSLASEVFMTLGFNDLDMWEDTVGEVNQATKEGRAGFTGDEMEKYAFKVPPLYNLKDTNVFGHGGSFTSVADVVRYKIMAVAEHSEVESTNLDHRFVPLDLTDEEVSNLVIFLEDGLHDPDLMRYVPEELPSGNCVTNNDEQSREELGCTDNGQ